MRHTIFAAAIAALLIAPALAGTGIGKGNSGDTAGTGIGKGSGNSSDAAAPPPPPPPMPAKPQAMMAAPVSGIMIVHHRVADYAKWRPVFDGDKANQETAGLTHPHVYAGKNANDVYITFDMADEAKAKAFAESKTLRMTMRKAGVRGAPDMMYLTPE